MKHKRQLLWFLWGLGGQLQLFGTSLCFTEIFVYLAGPLLFTRELPYMRRNGIMPFFWLAVGVMINGGLSCVYNHTPFYGAIRGMAVVCLLPCAIVVSHWMLRRDMLNFKWAIVGGALSRFLATFIFQKAVDVTMLSEGVKDSSTAAAIMNGPLWWISQLGSLLMTLPRGWYLQFPTWLSAGLPLGLAAFALFTSASGRSTALGSLGSAILIFLGGKKPSQIKRRICNHFWALCIVGIVSILAFKTFYKVAAKSGLLGEASRTKYEIQTRQGEDIMSLLLGGRMASFCGLTACIDQPIIGFGPWAIDTKGYTARFLAKYGTIDDYNALEGEWRRNPGAARMIPCHAHITEFWCWYGIMGLVLWLYIIYVTIRYLRQDCYAIPQWFMWLAACVPGFFWNIFFSPFSSRVGSMLTVVSVLLARAVRKGIQPLPYEMINEIRNVESK